jgi:hypothetical protein
MWKMRIVIVNGCHVTNHEIIAFMLSAKTRGEILISIQLQCDDAGSGMI